MYVLNVKLWKRHLLTTYHVRYCLVAFCFSWPLMFQTFRNSVALIALIKGHMTSFLKFDLLVYTQLFSLDPLCLWRIIFIYGGRVPELQRKHNKVQSGKCIEDWQLLKRLFLAQFTFLQCEKPSCQKFICTSSSQRHLEHVWKTPCLIYRWDVEGVTNEWRPGHRA